MTKVITILCVLTLTAGVASADRLILVDGRIFSGTVTVENGTVQIEMTYGTLLFDSDEVLDIQYQETLESQLRRMMQQTPQDDPEAVFALGGWARENGLTTQASELFQSVLKLAPNHVGAHHALGHVHIDQKWREFGDAMELVRSKLEAEQFELLLNEILPEMEAAAQTIDRLVAIIEFQGQAQLRSRQFDAASKTFRHLGEATEPPAALRYAAIAEILTDNTDGMYVLSEPYPPATALLGESGRWYPAGPASLADPIILEAALRDLAKGDVELGRASMVEGGQLESTDPNAANAKYDEALNAFDRADALVPEISRSYRVEIARRKVAILRSEIEVYSAGFDREMDELGKVGMSSQDYHDRVTRMIHSLDLIHQDLQSILEIAKVYQRELVLEIEWAEADLKRVQELRTILASELNEEK